jgi:hypothetical protein
MKKTTRRKEKGQAALELLEEATLLLRRAPLPAVAAYCTGTFPFALGLLFFWADMSRSSQAPGRLIDESFLLALLYFWMKWWQAIFAGKLRRVLTGQPAQDGLQPGELLRQGALQSWSVLVLPIALLVTIPFGWCFAFFQNLTVLAGEEADLRGLFRRAARQAALWPGQNHILLSLLLLCWLICYLNLGIVFYLVPTFLKATLGIDTLFARSNTHFLNSTFFCAVGALAWLCLDPLVKAVYLLRCYQGESLRSGADLLRRFRKASAAAKAALPLCTLLIFLSLATGGAAAAQGAQPGGVEPLRSAPALSSQRLEQAIARTLRDPEFSWRLPRKASEKEPGAGAGWVRAAVKRFGEWSSDAVKWFFRMMEKLFDLFPHPAPREQATGAASFGDRVFWVMYGALGLLVAWGVILLRRRYLSGRAPAAAGPVAAAAPPDLSDESVSADELPSEGWKQLSDELFARGEGRLALRALYLAALAHLAAENYLTLARAKSNREYLRELQRRAHTLPLVAESFGENVQIFERVWYGLHDLQQEVVQRFVDNYGRIVSHARRV